MRRPRNQTALADMIADVENLLQLADGDDITLRKTDVSKMIELLKTLRLGGRPSRTRRSYMREWAILIESRERKARLRASGKSAAEADNEIVNNLKASYPEIFGNRSKATIKEWLQRDRPRRYR